ncbi:MAG: site-2 protease family protein [Anaerolineae bacterium]|nr:site-2 protease family protein [Anaerolineae bacterium]
MDALLRWPSGLEWLAVIPLLSILVFAHELGHFLAALWMKVRVEEFGFGYPPRMLVLFERNGVKYTLNWLPFGGFVRMAGEERGFEDPGSLAAKAPWQRFIVFAAGPTMNVLLAVLIYIGVFAGGIPEPVGPVVIQEVAAGSPAAQAGLQAGDVLTHIGGAAVRSFTDVQDSTAAHLGEPVEITVLRDQVPLTITLVPRRPEDTPEGQGAMGVTISLQEVEDVVYRRTGPIRTIWLGIQRALFLVGAMMEGLGRLILSLFTTSVPAPEGGISGPVGIARLAGEVARGGWLPFLDLTGFLSLNFALINVLPLPALDGGHIAFVLLEWVRRGKRVPPEKEALVHLAGMVILIGLMLVVSYLDVVRWIQGESVLPGG